MDLQTLGNFGEFVGGLVVVISVVYLAMQIRQHTLAQRTQNYAVALDRLSGFQARMSQDEAYGDLLRTGVLNPGRLTRQHRIQFTWAFYEMFGAFEFMFHQASSGALPPEVWERWRSTLQWWMAFPGVQQWWDSRPSPFTATFTREVESVRRAGLPDRAAQQRWTSFLLGDAEAPPLGNPE